MTALPPSMKVNLLLLVILLVAAELMLLSSNSRILLSEHDKGKLAALLDAFLAIPKKTKTTTERVGNAEIVTVRQGRKILWRSYHKIGKPKAAMA
jgi:hypothetical protein